MAQLTLKVKKVANKNLRTKVMGFASRAIANGVATFDDICAQAALNTTLHPKSWHWLSAFPSMLCATH